VGGDLLSRLAPPLCVSDATTLLALAAMGRVDFILKKSSHDPI